MNFEWIVPAVIIAGGSASGFLASQFRSGYIYAHFLFGTLLVISTAVVFFLSNIFINPDDEYRIVATLLLYRTYPGSAVIYVGYALVGRGLVLFVRKLLVSAASDSSRGETKQTGELPDGGGEKARKEGSS